MPSTRRALAAAIVLILLPCTAPRYVSAAETVGISGPRLYPTVDQASVRRLGSSGSRATSAPLPLVYHGGLDGIGVTIGAPAVYLVFWGSQWGAETPPGSLAFGNDPDGVAPRLAALFGGIGTANERWSGVMTQYCEDVPVGTTLCPSSGSHVPYPTSPTLAGVWADTGVPAPTSATVTDLGNEAIAAAAHFGNTTAASNRNAQYLIVSATGTHPDGFGPNAGFCAWHSHVSSSYGDLAFTNFPYIIDVGQHCGENFLNAGMAGVLDGVTMVAGHEYAETLTDQNPPGGWFDTDGWENADKCVWISTGIGRAQNLAFATGSFPMQSTWSNDGGTCAIGHAIWGESGGPNLFATDLSPHSGFVTPGATATSALVTATVSGQPQALSVSVTGGPPDATVTLSASSIVSDDAVTLTIATATTTPFGQYPMTITVSGSTVQTLDYVLTVGPPPASLQNGVAVGGISGDTDSDQVWQFDVPTGAAIVDFTIGAGTGDADLFVARGTLPTDAQYTCRSVGPTTLEDCSFYTPASDRWYVRVHGAAPFSDVSLQATYGNLGFLYPFRTFRVDNIAGQAGTEYFFYINVPYGARKLSFRTLSRNGFVSMYVRGFGLPTSFANDCAATGHRAETCTIRQPGAGTWFLGLHGDTDFSDVSLKTHLR
jgi:serine protease